MSRAAGGPRAAELCPSARATTRGSNTAARCRNTCRQRPTSARALSGHTNTQNTVQMRVLSLLSHISTHEHSQRSPKASSGCSRWPYRPSAQLGQAHRMNGGPGRRCCGVASVTPRCRVDSASQFDPADAWSDDHRQQSPTRAHRRRAGALRRIELEPDARGCRQSACEPPRAGARC